MAIEGSTSSSPLILFIDTNLDTHLSFTIDGDQSIAELKGRMISEYLNCFPMTGKISIQSVKVKCGEIFYHVTDSMILNLLFEHTEGGKFLQIDITPSTTKSSNQTISNTDGGMDERWREKDTNLNCNSGHKASVLFDAKMDEKVWVDTTTKDSSDLKYKREKKKKVSSNEELPPNPLVINAAASENPPAEICSKVSTSTSDHINASVKYASDLKRERKRKKKVPSNEELPCNPLVDSSQKINLAAADNLPEVTICKTNHIITSVKDPKGLKRKSKKYKKVSSNEELPPNHLVINAAASENPPAEICSKVSTSNSDHINASVKHASDLKRERKRKKKVSSNEELPCNPLVDSSQKINLAAADNLLEVTICKTNHIITSVKDPKGLKRKSKKQKKVPSSEQPLHNPLVDYSLQKINGTASEIIPPGEILTKERISKNNEMAASSNKLSHHDNLQHVESLVHATVDGNQERYEKFSEVPPQTKLVNRSVGDAAADASQVKEFKQEKKGNENVYSGVDSEILVQHNESSMGRVDDASHKNRSETGIVSTMEKKRLETDKDMNLNSVQEANTSVKNSTDLEVLCSEEHPLNPPVEASSHKVNENRADNQPKESSIKETVSNSNDCKSDSGIAASTMESSQPGNVQNVESLPQTTVDDEDKMKEKVIEVPGETDSAMNIVQGPAIQIRDDKGEDGNAAGLDDSIKVNAPAQRRKPRRVVNKISTGKFRALYNRSPPASGMLGANNNAPA